jgi:hypothetical protein
VALAAWFQADRRPSLAAGRCTPLRFRSRTAGFPARLSGSVTASPLAPPLNAECLSDGRVHTASQSGARSSLTFPCRSLPRPTVRLSSPHPVQWIVPNTLRALATQVHRRRSINAKRRIDDRCIDSGPPVHRI